MRFGGRYTERRRKKSRASSDRVSCDDIAIKIEVASADAMLHLVGQRHEGKCDVR